MSKKPSQQEIKKLKDRLIKDDLELVERIGELRSVDPFSDPDRVNDNAAIDTDVREELGHETIAAQITTLQKKLDLVRAAIDKIDKKKYGICESCKKAIAAARLKLLPEARYCISCERRLIK